MNFINIDSLLSAVRNIEKQEAIRILKEHDGLILVDEDDCVGVEYEDTFDGPKRTLVKKIMLNKDETDVIIIAYDDIDGGTFKLTPEDLYPGGLAGVFASIN